MSVRTQTGTGLALDRDSLEGVPVATGRTAPEPLQALATALLTDEDLFRL